VLGAAGQSRTELADAYPGHVDLLIEGGFHPGVG
jgi:hypothetical protein